MRYTDAQRRQIADGAKGKTVESLEFEEPDADYPDGYWVMMFTDGTEISFRFIGELVQP